MRVHADAMPGPSAEEKLNQAVDALAKLVALKAAGILTGPVEVVLRKELLS